MEKINILLKKEKKRRKFKFKENCKDNLAELFSCILITLVTRKISRAMFLAWVSGCGGKNKYHLIQATAFVYGTPQAVDLKYVWY